MTGLVRALLRVAIPAFLASLLLLLLVRELSRAWFMPGILPDIVAQLEQAQHNERELARLDPGSAPLRRERYERTRSVLRRLTVLSLSRAGMTQRHVAIVLGSTLALGLVGAGFSTWRHSRREKRLDVVRHSLEELAATGRRVRVGDARGDVLGQVARMIERVSDSAEENRRRLATLDELSQWQEAARRHSHEMRTPLAAARLELGHLRDEAEALPDADLRDRLSLSVESLAGDLRRLEDFAAAFGAFGRLPPAQPVNGDLRDFVAGFCRLFTSAWEGVALRLEGEDRAAPACFDRELLRQVLVNLCDNAAQALARTGRADGTITFRLARNAERLVLDVSDDGPGIPPEIGQQLFRPYTSFREGGLGLGLAIARKILLDHGGQLDLVPSDPPGATFRLQLPRVTS
jgi:two-component system nitrogen regulation sensor histidine kinase NtrY